MTVAPFTHSQNMTQANIRARCAASATVCMVLAILAGACQKSIGGAGSAKDGGQESQGSSTTSPTPDEPLNVDGAALDVHTHIMSPELTAAAVGPDAPPATAEDLVARLDEANVGKAVVLSLAYNPELPDQAAVQAENDYNAAEVAQYPDRLIGFCGINPLRPFAVDEVARCKQELELEGVKIHIPAVELDVRDEAHLQALNAVFDEVAALDLPVLMHAGAPLGVGLDSDGLTNLAGVIASHPSVRLVMAHCTNDADRDEMETWIAGMQDGIFNADNLYVETSSCLRFYKDAPAAQKELMVWRLRTWGIERVFFGSDYARAQPVETPSEGLETLGSYPFTQEEIDMILNNDGSTWIDG